MSKQNLSILFSQKTLSEKGERRESPLFIRITIDGKDTEISLSRKIAPETWDTEAKQVITNDAESKITNKKIKAAQVDLDRHFVACKHYLAM
jgi:hypothetical protein